MVSVEGKSLIEVGIPCVFKSQNMEKVCFQKYSPYIKENVENAALGDRRASARSNGLEDRAIDTCGKSSTLAPS